MKKLPVLLLSLVLAFVFLNSSSSVLSQNEKLIPGKAGVADEVMESSPMMINPDYYPVPNKNSYPFAGENHWYSVVFRGNGEAVITLRVALANTDRDESPLRNVFLRLPEIIPSDISVYQIFAQGNCIRYGPRPLLPGSRDYQENYAPSRCIEYNEPDYFNYYGGGRYQKAKYEYSGDTLTIELPTPIQPDKSGSYFVYFRAYGLAKKNLWGAYKYTFESLKTEKSINQLHVGISTDSDIYLKGVKGEVDYRFDEAPAMMKMEAAGTAVSNTLMDRVVSQIGQGTIEKNASNLAPLEAYKVKGMYANSRLKLYGKEIVLTLAAILILAAVIFLLAKKLLGKMALAPVAVKEAVAKDVKMQDNVRSFLTSLAISFVSSLALFIYSIFVFVLFNNFDYIDYPLSQVLGAATIIFSFCIYSVGLFVPGIYYGYKKGIGWGIATIVLTVFWLFIYFMAGLALFFFVGFNRSFPTIAPPM